MVALMSLAFLLLQDTSPLTVGQVSANTLTVTNTGAKTINAVILGKGPRLYAVDYRYQPIAPGTDRDIAFNEPVVAGLIYSDGTTWGHPIATILGSPIDYIDVFFSNRADELAEWRDVRSRWNGQLGSNPSANLLAVAAARSTLTPNAIAVNSQVQAFLGTYSQKLTRDQIHQWIEIRIAQAEAFARRAE